MSMCKCAVRMKLPAFRRAVLDSRRLEPCTDNRHKTLKRSRESFAAPRVPSYLVYNISFF